VLGTITQKKYVILLQKLFYRKEKPMYVNIPNLDTAINEPVVGKCKVRLEDAQYKTSDKGSPFISLKMLVLDAPAQASGMEATGKNVFITLNVGTPEMKDGGNFCNTIINSAVRTFGGVPTAQGIDLDTIIGTEGEVVFGTREYNGNVQQAVTQWVVPSAVKSSWG